MTKIVVGVDGSDESVHAVRWAAREAELHGAELVAVLVWDLFNQRHADGEARFDPAYDDDAADAALGALLEAALGAGPAAGVTRLAVCDVPAQGLLHAAEGADLLVMGARGLGGFRGLVLGSVSQQCLHHATGPVAIVRAVPARSEGEGEGERIVVGVDGSEPSTAALRWALVEASLRGATVDAVHSWEPPPMLGPVAGGFPLDTALMEDAGRELLDREIAAARAAIGEPDVTVRPSLAMGGAAATLVDAAEGADLMVIGRRGVGGFTRLLLGSVSENVARHAPCPVVVMPPC